jgi:carnitine 3-dehydrogenase
LLATGEQMMLHVDTTRHKACEAAPEVLGLLGTLAAAHRGLPVPNEAGRGIGLK